MKLSHLTCDNFIFDKSKNFIVGNHFKLQISWGEWVLREHQFMNMDLIWYEQVPTDMNFQIAPLKTFLPVLLLSRFPLTQPMKFSGSFKGVSASWYIKADKVLLCAGCIFVSCCRIQLQTMYKLCNVTRVNWRHAVLHDKTLVLNSSCHNTLSSAWSKAKASGGLNPEFTIEILNCAALFALIEAEIQ